MISTKNLLVSTNDFNSLTFSWEYEHLPPGVDLTTTTIDIQRSESPNFSSYETIIGGLNANTNISYTDSILSGVLTQRYKDMNYRLRFVELDGIETISNKVFLIEPENLKSLDIIRRKKTSLRLHGLAAQFIKRMNYGQPCTDCYDPLLDMEVDGNCATCYNTQFVGGYYAPINIQVFMTQTPDVNLISKFGEFNPGQAIISIAAYPELSVNDLLVDNLNRRWYITQVRNVSLQGYNISQDATVALIDRNDVRYELEVT